MISSGWIDGGRSVDAADEDGNGNTGLSVDNPVRKVEEL